MLSSVGFKFNFQLQNDVKEVSESNEKVSPAKKDDIKEQQCEENAQGANSFSIILFLPGYGLIVLVLL